MNTPSDPYDPELPLRSRNWFEPLSVWGIIHRGWMQAQGFSKEVFDGKPVIGIANSWSELNNCNSNLRQLAEAVKRGVWQAGGFPLEFPTISLGEPFMKPTTMLYRNLMAMDVEEMIVSHPLDAVVLLGGCDKTTPAQVMGAVSANVPSIFITSGPMLNSNCRGRQLGSGHDITDYLSEYQSGMITKENLCEMESCISRSTGHCMVMGTASTMACVFEAMGLMLPGGATIPGPDSRRQQLAEQAGRRAVAMASGGPRPRDLITPKSLENGIRALHAIGGSSNGIVHLTAIARRLGYDLPLEHIDRLGRDVPLLVNIMPAGKRRMEDFHEAGGMPAVLRELEPLLHTDVLTVTGETLGEWIQQSSPAFDRDMIGTLNDPIGDKGSLRMLRGNLCPDGAVIKAGAASPNLLKHTGPALVFDNYEILMEKLNDPDLDVTPDHVLVLRGGGPVGAPGMPEWGVFGIPTKLYKQGVRDMVRISDARASGTSHGTIVVHISPESAVGGPLALVQDGDRIRLDVENGSLELLIDEEEMLERSDNAPAFPPRYHRGYKQLYCQHVTQAHHGVDFDFMEAEDIIPFPGSS